MSARLHVCFRLYSLFAKTTRDEIPPHSPSMCPTEDEELGSSVANSSGHSRLRQLLLAIYSRRRLDQVRFTAQRQSLVVLR